MAIEECGDYPAIEKVSWSGGKLLVRGPLGNGNRTIPVAFQVESGWIVCSAAPAVVAHHLVLERLARHQDILPAPKGPGPPALLHAGSDSEVGPPSGLR